ncbi:MAG: hypothetical protein E7591_03775 [Ruminococcaceae bacterium]|nr:hypothetical protein [Oscillospiraceae bacterium]
MFYDKDLIKNQVETLVNVASKILFAKNEVVYEASEDSSDPMDDLYVELNNLIENKEFGDGEDLIFDNFDISNDRYLILAIDYYHRLNEFEDDVLEDADFEREEVRDGLKDLIKKCGIPEDAMTV